MFPPIDIQKPSDNIFEETSFLNDVCYPNHINPTILEKNLPIPTNKWWCNLLSSTNENNKDIQPIWSNPYMIKIQLSNNIHEYYGIQCSYPHDYKTDGPLNSNNAIQFYFHPHICDLLFTCKQFSGNKFPLFTIESWDDFGVNIQLKDTNSSSSICSYFGSGMSFISSFYKNAIPCIVSTHAILSVNGYHGVEVGMTFQSPRLILGLNNGQQWVLYFFPNASCSIPEIRVQSIEVLEMTKLFNGVIRAAYVQNQQDILLYDKTASSLLIGGYITSDKMDGKTYTFHWNTKSLHEKEYKDDEYFLHFALSHHQNTIKIKESCIQPTNLKLHSTTHGPMRAFLQNCSNGKNWLFETIPQLDIGFYPPFEPKNSDIEQSHLLEYLHDEVVIQMDWNLLTNINSYYFNGKKILLFAQLCLLCKKLNHKLFSIAIEKLKKCFLLFIQNQLTYPLIYDNIYKGIITSEAEVKKDVHVDFGNAVYNDHHYHYGYWIHAASIVWFLDPEWTQRNSSFRHVIDTLIRDVANPSQEDVFFPKFRNFDWYNGHSYSHGIQPIGDGKDEESVSEEMNFHYGVKLWGMITQRSAIEAMGKLLINLNSSVIQQYFLMEDSNTIHPFQFIPNKVCGIFFDNKVDYTTWFSPAKECIHGIQMLPVSPILQIFRNQTFVQEEWEQVLSKLPLVQDKNISSPWQSLLYTNFANINKKEAVNLLQTCPLDDGLSRAYALYYAITRPEIH